MRGINIFMQLGFFLQKLALIKEIRASITTKLYETLHRIQLKKCILIRVTNNLTIVYI